MRSESPIPNLKRLVCYAMFLLSGLCYASFVVAADHGDAPLVSNDQGADIADVYAFLDPNLNSNLTLIITTRGFITPGESENLGFFQSNLNYCLSIETTGDATIDVHADVSFSQRSGIDKPQVVTLRLHENDNTIAALSGLTTVSSQTLPLPPPFVVTTDPASGISLFAGMTDDPFFFDVPAELAFRDSLRSGQPNPSVFDRGMDTFAGFNVMSVALSIPLSLINAERNTVLGVSGYTEPTQFTIRSRSGGVRSIGRLISVDRMGIPGINTVLLPYVRKDEYNRAATADDASGNFANDIIASLQTLNTSSANIASLAEFAVNNGDMLRLDTTIPNTGTNPEAGFPNGRRLLDDPIDIIVNIMANQLFDKVGGVVDNVNANDKSFGNVFPFLAPPHQPAGLGAPSAK